MLYKTLASEKENKKGGFAGVGVTVAATFFTASNSHEGGGLFHHRELTWEGQTNQTDFEVNDTYSEDVDLDDFADEGGPRCVGLRLGFDLVWTDDEC